MLNVFIAVDANYLKKSETMVYSLAVNAGERVNLFILHRDIPAAAVARFCRNLSKQNVKCTDIRISDDLFLSLTDGNAHFSTAMYYRIIAPFVLPRDLDRVLYLDADIIVNKDLCAFYNQPFGDRLLVACPSFDADSDEIARIKEKIGLSAEHVYFNSGVMLMNLEKMREETKLPQIMDVILRMQPVLTYPDQDILNKLYEGKVKYADRDIYNGQVLGYGKPDKAALEKMAVIHFAGSAKPWSYKGLLGVGANYYRRYRLHRSPALAPFLLLQWLFQLPPGLLYKIYVCLRRTSAR